MRHSLIRMLALFTAATLSIPASAQDDIDPPSTGRILLQSGHYLDIGKPRRIRDTNYVDSIDYRPGTHSIATTSYSIVDGQETSAIKLVQGDNGSEETLLSDTLDLHSPDLNISQDTDDKFTPDQVKHMIEVLERNPDMGSSSLTMRGWDRGGRYLLVEYQKMPAAKRPGKTVSIDIQTTPPIVTDAAKLKPNSDT